MDFASDAGGRTWQSIGNRAWQFLIAVVRHWGALVTGGVVIGLLWLWQGTGHTVKPWVFWLVAVVALFIASFKAWNDQFNAREAAEKTIQKLRGASPQSDPYLVLMEERRRLEAELQRLEEIEEGHKGARVIPAIKLAGKDQHDFRRDTMEQLKRDIRDVTQRIVNEGNANAGKWHSELSKEKMQLEDQIAKMEADSRHQTVWNAITGMNHLGGLFGGPNEAELKSGQIERRRKRLKELEDLLKKN